jgi:RpiR family glv operon transcriptional regulator
MRLEEIINKQQMLLNQTDMGIWKYIYNNREKSRHISIHELAHACAVSSTTIVRFAQKLGFDGFGELKAVLKMEENSSMIQSTDVLADIGAFYKRSWDTIIKRNFDEASRLIYEADRVFAFASGYVQGNVIQELKRLFFYDDVMIYEIVGKEEFTSILRTLSQDDLVIIVSLSGETPLPVEFARMLQMRDVPLISITRLHDNTLAGLSAVNLYVSPASFRLYEEAGHTQFQSMMPYFLLVEIWYVKYKIYLHENKDRL